MLPTSTMVPELSFKLKFMKVDDDDDVDVMVILIDKEKTFSL